MKVTSNIREYIKAEVAKILDSKVNPYAEQAKADKQMIDDFCKELLDVQRKMIDEFIEDKALLDGYHGGKDKLVISTSCPSFYYARTPAMIEQEKWEKEHKEYKVTKTREIIAKLELGANRQELEAMLAELLNE